MLFVIVGVLLVGLKVASIDPVAAWSWWWILAPFALAVAWWSFSDATGLTQRRAMDRMDKRKDERRRRSIEALGMDPRRAPATPAARPAEAARAPTGDPTQRAADAADTPKP